MCEYVQVDLGSRCEWASMGHGLLKVRPLKFSADMKRAAEREIQDFVVQEFDELRPVPPPSADVAGSAAAKAPCSGCGRSPCPQCYVSRKKGHQSGACPTATRRCRRCGREGRRIEVCPLLVCASPREASVSGGGPVAAPTGVKKWFAELMGNLVVPPDEEDWVPRSAGTVSVMGVNMGSESPQVFPHCVCVDRCELVSSCTSQNVLPSAVSHDACAGSPGPIPSVLSTRGLTSSPPISGGAGLSGLLFPSGAVSSRDLQQALDSMHRYASADELMDGWLLDFGARELFDEHQRGSSVEGRVCFDLPATKLVTLQQSIRIGSATEEASSLLGCRFVALMFEPHAGSAATGHFYLLSREHGDASLRVADGHAHYCYERRGTSRRWGDAVHRPPTLGWATALGLERSDIWTRYVPETPGQECGRATLAALADFLGLSSERFATRKSTVGWLIERWSARVHSGGSFPFLTFLLHGAGADACAPAALLHAATAAYQEVLESHAAVLKMMKEVESSWVARCGLAAAHRQASLCLMSSSTVALVESTFFSRAEALASELLAQHARVALECYRKTLPANPFRRRLPCRLCGHKSCRCRLILHEHSIGSRVAKKVPASSGRSLSPTRRPGPLSLSNGLIALLTSAECALAVERSLLGQIPDILSNGCRSDPQAAASTVALLLDYLERHAPRSLKGGGRREAKLREKVLANAPALSQAQVLEALEDSKVGDWIAMTWRHKLSSTGKPHVRTWCGQIIEVGGTSRVPLRTLRWELTPMGEMQDESTGEAHHPVSSIPSRFLSSSDRDRWEVDTLQLKNLGPGDTVPFLDGSEEERPATPAIFLPDHRGSASPAPEGETTRVSSLPAPAATAVGVVPPVADGEFTEMPSAVPLASPSSPAVAVVFPTVGFPSDGLATTPAALGTATPLSPIPDESSELAPIPSVVPGIVSAAVVSEPSKAAGRKPNSPQSSSATGAAKKILDFNEKSERLGNYAPVGSVAVPLDVSVWPTCPPSPSGPGLSMYSGQDLLPVILGIDLQERRKKVPSIVWAALSAHTMEDHERELRRFGEYLSGLAPEQLLLPVDVLLAHHFQCEWASTTRRTSWPTMSTRMRSIIGALSMLPVYAQTSIVLQPSRFPLFSKMLETAKRKTTEQPGRQPVAATYADVKAALPHLKEKRFQWLLLVSWYTSSRPTFDTVYVMTKDFFLGDDGKGSVTFRRSKTAKSVGAYTIPINVSDPDALAILKEYTASVKGDFMIPLPATAAEQVEPRICSAMNREITGALRKVRPELELKSLRRGTVKRLAELDLSPEEIVLYTKHTTLKTLKTYLNDEKILHREQRAAQDKAAGLGTVVVSGGSDEKKVDLDFIRVGTQGSVELLSKPSDDILQRDRRDYTTHCKPQTREGIDYAKLESLSAHPSVVRDWLAEKHDFLTDASGSHSSVPFVPKQPDNPLFPRPPEPSTIKRSQVDALMAINNVALIDPADYGRIKGWIRVFTVPEDAKRRWRVIKHPRQYNDVHGPDTVRSYGNATRRTARSAILHGSHAIAMDLAGFFDQLWLPDDVSWHQVFECDGRLFRNLRVPMGGRHSTQIATAITRLLLSFDHPGVRVDFCTDNVRFVGSAAGVAAAAKTFVNRCATARLQLNEINVDKFTDRDIADLVRTRDADFVGEVMDYSEKTVKCRQAHVDKLRALVANLKKPALTARELFAPYAMLLYMSETLGLRLDTHFATRSYYSAHARELAKDPTLWDGLVNDRPGADFYGWVQEALSNRPNKVSRPAPPRVVAIGDACEQGYAAILCMRTDSGWRTSLVQRRWSVRERSDLRTQHSSVSEPEAAVRIAKLLDRRGAGPLLYVTDHSGFVDATDAGYSLKPEYNVRVRNFRNAQPNGALHYLEGVRNVADKFSRFKAFRLTAADRRVAVTLAEEALAARDTEACVLGAWEDPTPSVRSRRLHGATHVAQ